MFGAGSAHASGGLHAVFADCTGKLSAQLEHEWLMSDEGAAETQQTLAQFQDLLQATTPPDERRSTRRGKFFVRALIRTRYHTSFHQRQKSIIINIKSCGNWKNI
ncbi:MAG: hypothetical protein F6K35_35675 [Okeania sp. SIO2H7]|nr:hypothetical protein [Okeania sp. SIO2H7]